MNKLQFIVTISLVSFLTVNAQVTNSFPDDGNVGIGTTTPSSKLEVKSTTGNDAEIHINAGSSGDQSIIRFLDQGQRTWGFLSNYPNTGKFSLYNYQSNTNSIVLDSNGNVGIGTKNPTGLLEIQQVDDPNSDKGLIISELNNSQQIRLHLADNTSGEYGFLLLGGNTTLRGNGQPSFFEGAIGIGTTTLSSYQLAVKGKIRAEEIKVETGWADYVFKENYDLPTLKEVEEHIKEKGHLINIPSAKEVEENGIQLGEMNKLLLEKIEELTLYTLQQQKQLSLQKEKNKSLEERLAKLEHLITTHKNQK